MNGEQFAYLQFHLYRVRTGQCKTLTGSCVICELMWEGWP